MGKHLLKFRKIILGIGLLLFLSGCGLFRSFNPPRMSASAYIDGYWGKWYELRKWAYKGCLEDRVFYCYSCHPSEYIFKIHTNQTINTSSLNVWLEYSGYIEYRDIYNVTSSYTPNNKRSRYFVEQVDEYLLLFGRNYELTRRPAKIKVNVERKKITYNVFFDGVGIGVCMTRK